MLMLTKILSLLVYPLSLGLVFYSSSRYSAVLLGDVVFLG